MKKSEDDKPRIRVLEPGRSNQLGGLTRTPAQGKEPVRLSKLRVAAYARTSTDMLEQETSFEAQQTHFRSIIRQNRNWELVDIYADEESGTRVFHRENFQRMIQDCEAGKIDLILTKSISRWARNTLDSLKYIRKLKAMGVGIIFTKEGIDTRDSSGEVLITIMSSIAQQESASISQNIQLGVRYHFQEGKICSGVYQLLGYERTKNGTLEIIPKEAAIVRRIYREYLDGYSVRHIAERLSAEGVDGTKTTNTGIKVPRKWNGYGLRYILQNEKYAGDMLLQKYYTVDFLEKKVAPNNGQLPQYYVENSHPPIVPREIFLQVQAELARRTLNPKAFRYLHGSGLSGRIFCGVCGTPYRARRSGKKVVWRCETKVNRKRYPNVTCSASGGVRDETVNQAIIYAFNHLPEYREELAHLEERFHWYGLHQMDAELTELNEQMSTLEGQIKNAEGTPPDLIDQWETLQKRWLETSTFRTEYVNQMIQLRNLRVRMDAIEGVQKVASVEAESGACRTGESFFHLTETVYRPGMVDCVTDGEIIKFIERIVVDEETIRIVWRAGIEITVERTDR